MISAVGNLPSPLTSFVGRQRDIVGIRRLLGAARLLTLTGVAGVGKTRLALEAAAASRKGFPDGVWLVDLAPLSDPSGVANATADALGVPDLGARPVFDQLARQLAGRRSLILLDNCEHVVDGCAELAQALLSAAPELCVLATSRRTLGITGERVFTVEPLPPDEAVELLRERAAAVLPEYRGNEVNGREVAARLCADLDRLPLAIELTASRLRTLTVEEVTHRLEDRFALLTGGCRSARPRQRTLRAAIDWSYELCSPAERLLWSRLSVFVGGFGLEAAEDVCSGAGIDRHDVPDLLDRLVAQSVVVACRREGRPGFQLLQTIRHYGRQRLTESGEHDALRRRHRGFFLTLAQRLADSWCGPGQAQGLAVLRAEHTNLREALDCGDDPQATLALATALRFHWCVGGFLGEGRRQLDRALAGAPEPTPTRARALWAAAWVALLQGDRAAAERWLDEADDLGEKLDDPLVRAYVQGLRGSVAAFQGRLAEAVPLFEVAVDAHRELGETAGAVFVLFQLAVVRTRLGDERAQHDGRQAVALAQAHGERWGCALALRALGYDAWVRGDWEAGKALTRAALEIERDFHDYVAAALVLGLLASLAAAGGEHERAASLLGATRALCRRVDTTIAALGSVVVEDHARCEEAIVAALGPAAYEKALADGGRHDTPAQAIAHALGTAPENAAAPTIRKPLTRREEQVSALVADGMTNRQIASALKLSPRTVDGHVENVLAKLAFGRRTQIATWWAAGRAPARRTP
nr:LuxR C-terminal-related transcriptional regulator [Kitasatospora viridis]